MRVQAILRGGNHPNRGVAPQNSGLGIPIRAVWAALRPFLTFDAGPVGGAARRPKPTQNGPKQAVEGALRVAKVPELRPVRPQWATRRHGPGPRSPRCFSGPFLAVFWPFLAVFGPFWAAFGQFWTPPPPPLVGPPRGPVEGFCPGIGVLKRACVGEERHNLGCGLAPSRIFLLEIRGVKCCCCLLVVACSYYGERGVVIR